MSHFVKNSDKNYDLHLDRDSAGGCIFPLVCPVCGKSALNVAYPIYGSAGFEIMPDGHRGKRTDDVEIDFDDPPNIFCNTVECDFSWDAYFSSDDDYTGNLIETTPEPEKNNG